MDFTSEVEIYWRETSEYEQGAVEEEEEEEIGHESIEEVKVSGLSKAKPDNLTERLE